MSLPSERSSPLLTRLAALAEANPELGRVHAISNGCSASLAELLRASKSRAAELRARFGNLRERPVLLAAPPGLPWVEGFLALLALGAICVPVPTSIAQPEFAHLVADSGAVLLLGSLPPGCAVGPLELVGLDPIRSPPHAGAATFEPVALGSDVAMLLYTSGTTGRPKGARITHDNLAAQTTALREAWGFVPEDVLLHVLPLHHVHGITVALLTALSAGAEVRMMPRFEVASLLAELPSATVLMTVPTMIARIVDHVAERPEAERAQHRHVLSGLRLVTCGSAALPAPLAEAFAELSGAIPLERYGMTEIGIALSNPLEASQRLPGSVGRTLPCVELELVSEEGDAPGKIGELWARGPAVFAGYHGQDAAAVFEPGGWFRTGDIGERRDDGSFRLLGRSSVDILKTGGEKVSALEIEAELAAHPAVAQVAVVGLPDPAWGDRVVAVVVLRPARAIEPEALRTWAKTRLSPYKVPKTIRLASDLPRNSMGKVDKPALVRRLTSEGV